MFFFQAVLFWEVFVTNKTNTLFLFFVNGFNICFQIFFFTKENLAEKKYFTQRNLKKVSLNSTTYFAFLHSSIIEGWNLWRNAFLRREFWFYVDGIANLLNMAILNSHLKQYWYSDKSISKWSFVPLWILTSVYF